jgi:Rrf2 family iron-sulfur cluster assembly transcriptional regulator
VIYSKTCEYAIRALIYFADHPEISEASVKEVGRETGVSASYVGKIFQCLVKSRILASKRGPSGGYSLLVPVTELTLLRIMRALDDPEKSPFVNCVMGLDKCKDANPCPMHPVWVKAKEKMIERLEVCTIANVAALGDKFRMGRQRRHVLSKQMREIFSV